MVHWTEQQIAKALKGFRAFLFIVWRCINLPPPTPIQNDMAKTLQKPPSDRFIVQGFRGVAKSFITCALVVWLLWRNPDLRVLIVSASKPRADANAVFIKRIIHTIPFLSHLKANETQRDTQNEFDVGPAGIDISPSVKSVGITGQITGTRADVLIADDVEVPGNSGTQVQREKLLELIKEFDAILKPGGQIIYLGTPQNEMSIYNELQKRGYQTLIWPVRYPVDKATRDFYGNRLAPLVSKAYDADPLGLAGKPTDPLRFNEEEIDKRRLSYGRAGFALQFDLNTNLSDHERFPLKCSDLIVTDLDLKETSLKWSWASGPQQLLKDVPCVGLRGDFFYGPFQRSPETAPYTGVVMAIDPSGRGKDETAYAIVAFLNGFLFVLEVGGYRDGYSDATLRLLATKAKYYGVNQVIIEPNFGDGMFTKLITPIFTEIHPCGIEETKRSVTMKEARIIDTLEPVLAHHRLIMNLSVIEDDYKIYENAETTTRSLIYQMTRISNQKGALAHDDRLDALALAIAYWIEVLDRDTQQGLDDYNEEFMEAVMDPDTGIRGYLEEMYENAAKPKPLKRHGENEFALKFEGVLERFLNN